CRQARGRDDPRTGCGVLCDAHGGGDGAGVLLLPGPPALSGRRLRGALHLRLDPVPDLWRSTGRLRSGARAAVPGCVLRACRPAQYGMNVPTLLVPLFGIGALANRVIARDTAYVDLKYRQALSLSTAYQAGIVAWVAFWAIYGRGLGAESLSSIATFAGSYMLVIVVEPLVDLGVLALAKSMRGIFAGGFVTPRLHHAA